MTKRSGVFIIIVAVTFSVFGSALFGRWLAVRLSMWPTLARFGLVGPQGPIIINNTEEVRVSGTEDVQKAFGLLRPKVSLLVTTGSGQAVVLGSALNLTSDGSFVTVKSVIDNRRAQDLKIKLDDGALLQVEAALPDSTTDLVILKTSTNSLSVVNLASSKNAIAGQPVIFIAPGLSNFSASFQTGFISDAQNSGLSLMSSDLPTRSFKVQGPANLTDGETAADLSGNVLGVWSHDRIISSDVIKDLSENYSRNNGQIIRPEFGFSYRLVTPAESDLTGQPAGYKIAAVFPGGPAQKAGLFAGDVIKSFGQKDLSGDASLEEILSSFKPGYAVSVTILRGGSQMTLNLNVLQNK